MIWNSDYKYGIFVSWYSCPICGYDTRNQNYATTWSDNTDNKEQTDEISERNMKMWEELFKAESEDKE